MSNPELVPSLQREIERLGRKFGTLNLVDQLITENAELREELGLTKQRLQELRSAIHNYLMGERSEAIESTLSQLTEEKRHD